MNEKRGLKMKKAKVLFTFPLVCLIMISPIIYEPLFLIRNEEFSITVISMEESWSHEYGGGYTAIADMDRDGLVDIITNNCMSEGLYYINSTGEEIWYKDWFVGSSEEGEIALADLDDDNQLEAIVAIITSTEEYKVYRLNKGGKIEKSYDTSESLIKPTIADLNGDKQFEILLTGYSGVYCFDNNLVKKWFYPISGGLITSTAVADLNEDGKLEIVIGSKNGNLYCINYDGTQILWTYETEDNIRGSASIADIDEDGKLEILVGSYDDRLHCVTHDGKEQWKYYTEYTGLGIFSTPAIADLDGDGDLEIVFTSLGNNHIYCVDHQKNSVWNKDIGNVGSDSPIIADLDNNGKMEIIASGQVFDCDGNPQDDLYGEFASIADLDQDGKFEVIMGTGYELTSYTLETVVSSGKAAWNTFQCSIFHTGSIDTDGDFLDDVTENYYSSDPNNNDHDFDGIIDGYEVYYFGSSPTNSDTDGDGLEDDWEIEIYLTSPINDDSDEDDLTDYEEVMNYLTDPNDQDTDGDTLLDGYEVIKLGTNPKDEDTDGDQMDDGFEVEYDLNPLEDDADEDPDSDDLTNIQEYNHNSNPRNEDTDEDGLLDGEEVLIYDTFPDNPDSDNDALTDSQEVLVYDTDPRDEDTDDDGYSDGLEVNEGFDPKDENSYPSHLSKDVGLEMFLFIYLLLFSFGSLMITKRRNSRGGKKLNKP
jgi:hypothetical protein